jgi:hypothetical protein
LCSVVLRVNRLWSGYRTVACILILDMDDIGLHQKPSVVVALMLSFDSRALTAFGPSRQA